ncbi:hypothetical protein N0B31_02975 [Salinirubellus salinus]|uniref:Uncharacterized protein n=1 Tax=Salinirubellus salinus TaxID=1364945 RepID=A0A9E7R5U4_9EURY|nr:hypothetical protein [Salinirubellus salinus]UWM55253.1 hypothetical protein N0B31_02975 [Salinirubellus salinus]
MPLRVALRLLDDRYDGQPAVWLVGLAFGLVLGAGYALLFVVDSPVTNAVGYAAFVLLVAPLFGAALWPYARGEPPGSLRTLVRDSLQRYPRLLGARVAYTLLLLAAALALVSLAGVLATLASAGNYLLGGGATTLGERAATGTAALVAAALVLVGLSVARVLFGFLDAAALERGTIRGVLDEALSAVLRAPGRVVAATAGLAVYRVGVPLVFYFFVATNVDTYRFVERAFQSPRLAIVPPDAPSYASAPDPSLAPELLAGLVLVDVLVTTAVWPVALGYHFTLFETIRAHRAEDDRETASAPSTAPEAQ